MPSHSAGVLSGSLISVLELAASRFIRLMTHVFRSGQSLPEFMKGVWMAVSNE
jgi:hypothetical protein